MRKKYPVNIFLPAAGLGERLRPITNHLPKPLLPILGKPIIEGILERLTVACGGKIGINLHWKPELIRAWAKTSPWADRITFFPEDPILGTGGALKNAESFLANGPFIVHNADILLDIDFTRLVETHRASGNTATLVCHRIPRLSNVVIDKNNQVLDVENPGDSLPDPATDADKTAYTGVALYSPEILQFLPPGVSHATVAWIAASKAGHKVRALDVTGAYWNDVGTPVTYARGVLDTLRNNGETVYRSKTADCGRIVIDGYTVLESGCAARDNARLRNTIVMPDAVATGAHENAIIGPDYEVALSESDMQPTLHAAEKKRVSLSDPFFARCFGAGTTGLRSDIRGLASELWSDAILIGLGGSDRRYFRVRNDGRTAVLMECRPDDPDYERHLLYTYFFATHTVPVPDLISKDDVRKAALFEDLGDTSLYSFMKIPHDAGRIQDLYSDVLDILVKLHGRVTAHIAECPLLQARVFDYEHLRWETGYFLEQFVTGLNRATPDRSDELDGEFHRLAQKVDGYPKCVIHRDYQSQNIMVAAGDIPRVIDFQGARMAPPAYDVASVLWDPYLRLDDRVRDRLLDYYVSEMGRGPAEFDEAQFRESLVYCRLQRHMQALGAYGFLSAVKGKKYFLKHVPEAVRLLREETASVQNEFPALFRLAQGIEPA